jgi:predicted nucleic acid-binding protein
MTLFDTDVTIWLTRGSEAAADVIDAEPIRAVSAVTYMELLHGALDARDARFIRRTLDNYGFRILPVTESISEKAVALMEAHALSVRIDPQDALIFATALDYDITLCSGNEKHFRPIQGLRSRMFRPE